MACGLANPEVSCQQGILTSEKSCPGVNEGLFYSVLRQDCNMLRIVSLKHERGHKHHDRKVHLHFYSEIISMLVEVPKLHPKRKNLLTIQ